MSDPPGQNGARNEKKGQVMLNGQQMELSLPAPSRRRAPLIRRRRLPGARWWFAQMRLAVANAVEWGSPPPAGPEQIDLLQQSGAR